MRYDGRHSETRSPPPDGEAFLSIGTTEGHGRATVVQRVGAFGRRHRLSAREEQIFLRLVQGSHPKIIGDALGCDYETVRTHLRRMQKKLGCAGTRELLVRFISEL